MAQINNINAPLLGISQYITKPSQIAFLAKLLADANTVTGDGTSYKILFDATDFNIGSQYSTVNNRFNAPVAGRYLIGANVKMTGIAVGHTDGYLRFISTVRAYTRSYCDPALLSIGGVLSLNTFIIIEMAAAESISLSIYVNGGAKSVNVISGDETVMYGYLLS